MLSIPPDASTAMFVRLASRRSKPALLRSARTSTSVMRRLLSLSLTLTVGLAAVTSRSVGSKPTHEMWSRAGRLQSMPNRPSASLAVPVVVPATTTDAPASGLPSVSVTRPATVCADACKMLSNSMIDGMIDFIVMCGCRVATGKSKCLVPICARISSFFDWRVMAPSAA